AEDGVLRQGTAVLGGSRRVVVAAEPAGASDRPVTSPSPRANSATRPAASAVGARGVAGSAALPPPIAPPLVLGCYPPQLLTLRSGLDSLRTVIDTMQVRDSLTYRVLLDTRREISEQRDVLLSTRATAGTTTKELFEQMSRLEARLEEVGG